MRKTQADTGTYTGSAIQHTNTISKKDYADGTVRGSSWLNFSCNTKTGRQWFDRRVKAKKLSFHLFSQTNKSNFTKLFGKHNFSFAGEVRYYVWELEFKRVKILAFTDKDTSHKGTTYEFMLKDVSGQETEASGKLVTEFVDEMERELTKLKKIY